MTEASTLVEQEAIFRLHQAGFGAIFHLKSNVTIRTELMYSGYAGLTRTMGCC